ncbi:TPA: ribbon-helix-helix domain-containing protein [Vibrio parahaemolyticus]|nr:ribbon-helix-helix domain-containing protein [Vibrio parahaemolyticus]HBC3577903.1 ribbon-helix-helix domain-containing protein [Vibrio parahaemolyticus]HBC3947637.1 ribbon-helix-helix domain-containing protein [Vibrio parahaemolyticus]HBH7882693.1 ribbon-helix-helix domain-containing protein [Vibrio parahaemolyticus]
MKSRSIRILGHVTSIRIENKYWNLIDEIALSEGKSWTSFINELYLEVLDRNIDARNFTSLLRTSCVIFLENKNNTK